MNSRSFRGETGGSGYGSVLQLRLGEVSKREAKLLVIGCMSERKLPHDSWQTFHVRINTTETKCSTIC